MKNAPVSLSPFAEFVRSQAFAGMLLFTMAILAFVLANSPWRDWYADFQHMHLALSLGGRAIDLSLHHWVNDFLMAVFFLLVGLEIKRELLMGELANPRRAALAVAGAVGGMLVPAALYAVFNAGGAGVDGWGIPMATDIAFALGILALLGSRVPIGLKIFLTALAIVDDLGAVLVIALFYTSELNIGGTAAVRHPDLRLRGVAEHQDAGQSDAGTEDHGLGLPRRHAAHRRVQHLAVRGHEVHHAVPDHVPDVRRRKQWLHGRRHQDQHLRHHAGQRMEPRRGQTEIHLFHRRIALELVLRALTVTLLSGALVMSGFTLLLYFNTNPTLRFHQLLFEAISAFATVGLSMDTTPLLNVRQELVIIALMFFGRIGPLTFAVAFTQKRAARLIKYPAERDVLVG